MISSETFVAIADRIKVKPLSVNKCWQGKRFKTKDYNEYEKLLLYDLLPTLNVTFGKDPLLLHVIFGVSNAASDNDNPLKPFQDILQKKYGFNDKYIYRTIIDKRLVPKGEEFIEFQLTKLTPEIFAAPPSLVIESENHTKNQTLF